MSKKARVREANAEKKRERLEKEQFEAKKAKVRKVTAIATSAVLGVGLLAGAVGYGVWTARVNSGEYLRSRIAASSKNIEVDGAMMTYFYNDIYNSFVDYYGSYVYYYGLDTTMSAKAQEVSDGETWFEYFMGGAQSNVESVLVLNEAANEEGIVLSDAERAAVSARVDGMDAGLYGRGVNSDDILSSKLLEATAYSYRFAKERELAPTYAEIAEEYENNTKSYDRVEYLAYEVSTTSGYFDEESAADAVERLSSAKSEKDFLAVMRELELFQYPETDESTLDEELEAYRVEDALYTEGDGFSEWAFGGAKVGETFKEESDGATVVYYLTGEPERDESSTVSVRHIMFATELYESSEAALAAATDAYARLDEMTGENDEGLEDAVKLLALELSDDDSSYYNGGLCENIVEGVMETDFNDWCFSPMRKSGEVAMIETSLGYHIMYFIGEGREVWESQAAETLVSDRFTEHCDALLEEHPVNFDLTVLDEIPG